MEPEDGPNVISQQCTGLECSMQTSQLQLLGAGSHEGWSSTRARLEMHLAGRGEAAASKGTGSKLRVLNLSSLET